MIERGLHIYLCRGQKRFRNKSRKGENDEAIGEYQQQTLPKHLFLSISQESENSLRPPQTISMSK